MKNIDQLSAVITGGASGIGRAIGEELAARGCEVILADIQLEQAEDVAASICASGGKASAYALDVTDVDAVEQLVKNTYQRHQRLDYMFNNAGVAKNGKCADFELAENEDLCAQFPQHTALIQRLVRS